MQNKIPHDKSKKVTISYEENPKRPRNHSAGTHRIQSGDLCVLCTFHLGIAHLRLPTSDWPLSAACKASS